MVTKIKNDENEKLDAIVNAAQKRFGHYGLCKTTMNEIASDIGMGKASLYYYFPDKEKLFEAVVIKEQNEFLAEVNKMIKPGVKAPLLLKQYVTKRMVYFQRFLNLALLKSESISNPKPVICRMCNDFRAKEVELIQSIIQIGISNKEFRKVNSLEYADFFTTVMQGIRISFIKSNGYGGDLNDLELINKHMAKTASMFIKEIQSNSNSEQ